MIKDLLHDYIMTGKNTHLKDPGRNGVPIGVGEVGLFPLIFEFTTIIRGIAGFRFEMIRDTILILGFFFIWVSQIKHPLKLSRMYYLCPMDATQRSTYLKNAFLFQSCLHSLVVVITALILYFGFRISIFAFLYIMIDGILYGFLSNVRDRKKDFIRAAFLKPAMFVTAYLQFVLPTTELGRGDFVFIACSFSFLLLIELPLFVSIVKETKNDIVRMTSCEEDLYKC